MFVQVIQGRTSDPAGVRGRFDDWVRELGPGADGWLGTTAGVTGDGDVVVVVRFADEASARRNSDRPEQGEWWSGTAGLFQGEAVFHDYPHTELFLGGGSDDAGFVQVIQGRYRGDVGAPDMLAESDDMSERRPDVIGGSFAWNDEGHFTQTVYFTSEQAAREGERAMGEDPEVSEQMAEWFSHVDDLRYLNLTDPWLTSP